MPSHLLGTIDGNLIVCDRMAYTTDPRLWFSDATTGGKIVAAWAKDGPSKEIAAGKPFSVRWTGSLTAPHSEPFWFRVYNSRPGTGHTPIQQAWTEGKGFARVWLNDELVLDKWQGSPATNPWQTPPLMLEAGATGRCRSAIGLAARPRPATTRSPNGGL